MGEIILGIWDGHDAGAVLLRDGEVLGAMNEERLTRRKLEVGFPKLSIEFLLREYGILPSQVTAVAATTSDFSKTLTRLFPSLKEKYYLFRRRKTPPARFPNLQRKLKYFLTSLPKFSLSYVLCRELLLRDLIKVGIRPKTFEIFDHHDCHAMSAASASGFSECLVLTMDGLGDESFSKCYLWKNDALKLIAKNHAIHSLGIFFEQVTMLLNLRELEDEGKVMALANFSSDVSGDTNPFKDFFTVDGLAIKASHRPWAQMDRIRDALWRFPSEQVAFFAQKLLEEKIVEWTKNALAATGQNKIAYSGGVASNIKVNALIRDLPGLENFFVFPHMGDGGQAHGAAVLMAAKVKARLPSKMTSPLLGPSYTSGQIEEEAKSVKGINLKKISSVGSRAAEIISAGEVVFWFQGRMEFGPRALGARSILALPGSREIKDRVNLILKKRVWYQPFCPSMLESEARRLLLDYKPQELKWMTCGYSVKPEYREILAGVINVDGSCRPQIVGDLETGPYADLLRELKAVTGVGVVLNTSLNLHGEPLICSPKDVFRTFLKCEVSDLFAEDWHITKDLASHR